MQVAGRGGWVLCLGLAVSLTCQPAVCTVIQTGGPPLRCADGTRAVDRRGGKFPPPQKVSTRDGIGPGAWEEVESGDASKGHILPTATTSFHKCHVQVVLKSSRAEHRFVDLPTKSRITL
ncbi:hypothetical protein K431DRAFT_295191 [Polychaeton citri CBS 116435]|uniref:Secreted protein n=1 Tax=Polychaeton citri CBS 116435 TaxID=1314669 RepID=A0A9P4Q4A9_9PEZI|nr:hypothetical protein K431DRAFT_295191 [Polychaeton citri CBS 116435]